MTDDEIQQHVEDALDWAEPGVDGSRIRVTVDSGVVTLRGAVDSALEKSTAERVALRVRGVETIVNHLALSAPADTRATHNEHAPAGAQERARSSAAGT